MGNIQSLAEGLAQGLNGYLQGSIQQKRQQQNAAYSKQLDVQGQEDLSTFAQKQQGIMTPEMGQQLFSQVSPEFGQAALKSITDFKQAQGRDMTIDEATKALDPVMKGLMMKQDKASSQDDKLSKQQDALEKQYSDKLTTVRGDQSLLRSEAQRDAAGMAYDSITKAQSEGRALSEMEYADVLGQLWKVRTGASPTDQVLNDLKQKTAKEGFNRAVSYVTGNPNIVGATTDDTLNNIKQFVVSSGQKADQQWSAYMGPRMTPPSGLKSDRVDHVNSSHRGLSFAEQQGVSDKTYPVKKGSDIEAKKAALRAKLGLS